MVKKLRKLVSRLRSPLKEPLVLPEFSQSEMELIQSVREDVRALGPLAVLDSMTDSEKEWTKNRIALRNLMLYSDLRLFLRWEMIRHTMFTTEASFTDAEITYLKRIGKSIDDFQEDSVGSPDSLIFYPNTSGNLIHHEYHLSRFETEQDVELAKLPFILEFGGGYGSLCRLIQRRNYAGTYVIYDLPEFSILQKFFLKSIGVNVRTVEEFDEGRAGVYLVSEEPALKKILATKSKQSLLIGTWSLSETPVDFRKNFFEVAGSFSNYLLAYQDRFNEVDNVKYFDDFARARPDVAFRTIRISHLPGHAYLFGS